MLSVDRSDGNAVPVAFYAASCAQRSPHSHCSSHNRDRAELGETAAVEKYQHLMMCSSAASILFNSSGDSPQTAQAPRYQSAAARVASLRPLCALVNGAGNAPVRRYANSPSWAWPAEHDWALLQLRALSPHRVPNI
ncbi:MAG: hypothetical protein CM15mP103_01130 [Gammaproteobacteria bacterium]|nr:MAG: hypothetical protein CM15mP103_01130 [Gammaproteobacteria bacterium]